MGNDTLAPELQERLQALIERMVTLEANPALDPAQRHTLNGWRRLIDGSADACRAPLRVGFVGQIGMGKSSLIAAATGLQLRPPGSQATDPKAWSVLPVGDGNTTLGGLVVQASASQDDLVLTVQPVPEARLSEELTFLVEDTWRAARRPPREGATSGAGGAGEELYDLLRSWLTGGGLRKKEASEQIRSWICEHETLDGAVVALKSRLDFGARTTAWEQRFSDDDEGLRQLKDTLTRLMKGSLPDAPAPAQTTVTLPRGRGREIEIDELIDTQGLEPTNTLRMLTGRPDLLDLLNDPTALLVVCADYIAAPDPVALEVLKLLKLRGGRGEEGKRPWLLLVDKRSDTSSEDARADREDRLETCADRLRQEALDEVVPPEHVFALDVREEQEDLRRRLRHMAGDERRRREDRLRDALERAERGLGALLDVESEALRREMDLRLWWHWEASVRELHLEVGLGPLRILGDYVQRGQPWVHHWSHLHATIRRRGAYPKLDLVKVAASEIGRMQREKVFQLLEHLGEVEVKTPNAELNSSVLGYRDMLLQHLKSSLEAWQRDAEQEFAGALRAYFASPPADNLWADCFERWGRGPGYVADIGARLKVEEDPFLAERPRRTQRFRHEQALPPRPFLLRLEKVSASNFRNITQATQRLSLTTVIIGENGQGKTAWLEAVAKGLGAIFHGLGVLPAPRPIQEDVRQVTSVAGQRTYRQAVFPLSLQLEGWLEGKPVRWSLGLSGPSASLLEEGADALTVITQGMAQELLRWPERPLPVLAYYGTQRLWPPDLSPQPRKAGDRLEGYRDCLVAASTHQQMLSWVRDFTFAELQQQRPIPELRAIRAAVVRCVDVAVDFLYDIETQSLVLVLKNGDRLPFAQLSDGVRNIVALVADIAWRASVLNPQLGAEAPALAEGVVLLDEVDLHLHPKWQRHVLADLRAAFPRLQFITTTHSPFVIQSLEAGQLVNLNPNVPEGTPYADQSPEDIAEYIMGVPVPQQSQRRARAEQVAAQYFDLLEQLPSADPQQLAEVKAALDELLAPYDDNPAFAAFSQFLERKRALAEAQRP